MTSSNQADEAVVFGEHNNLVGITRHPNESNCRNDLAVLLLTPGMLHCAGPYRLHVDLAREFASTGLRSLRFDLSGIGESLAVGSAQSSLERAATEISAAIDYLSAHHDVKRVAIFGLCSGADDAIFAALRDNRIAGIFAMDGCGYRTLGFYWHRLRQTYLPKILNVSKWAGLIRKSLGWKAHTPVSLQLGNDIREFPTREVAETQLDSLARRGCQLHFHYTGGVDEYYNHGAQFSAMFPSLANHPCVSSSFDPSCDHVAFLCEHRSALVQLVGRTISRFCNRTEDDSRGLLANPSPISPTTAFASQISSSSAATSR